MTEHHAAAGKSSLGALALIGGAAALAFFAFGGTSKAAAPTPKPCGLVLDENALKTATVADLADLIALANKAKAEGCTDIANQVQKKIDELSSKSGGGGGGGGGTIPFNNGANIKNLQGLVNDAWTIAEAGPPLPPVASLAGKIADNGTFKSPSDFASYSGPLIVASTGEPISRSPNTIIRSMQANAGISVDGKWGAETSKAWSYGLSHGSPTSIGGEMGGPIESATVADLPTLMDLAKKAQANGRIDLANKVQRKINALSPSVAGETNCEACGSKVKIGSCCAACAAGGTGCADEPSPLVYQSMYDQLSFGAAPCWPNGWPSDWPCTWPDKQSSSSVSG